MKHLTSSDQQSFPPSPEEWIFTRFRIYHNCPKAGKIKFRRGQLNLGTTYAGCSWCGHVPPETTFEGP